MAETKKITTPFTRECLEDIQAGDIVLISGYIFTGRDAAHKRLCELLEKGEPLPIDVKGAVMYYVGPSPAKPGEPIGSAGPTTSYRMDAYTPQLLDQGLMGMIGKGKRSEEVIAKIVEHGCCYFAAIGGAAALIKSKIKSAELICYEDLGAEAVRRLYVEEFPVTCIIDSKGNNLYKIGRERYLESLH